MTELVYYQDQYKKELEAKVVKVEGNKVLLDKTIFIPESQNELGDLGKISNMRLAGLTKSGGDIWHSFQKTPQFKVGDTVKLELDWKRRLSMMQQHSSIHLLAGPFEKLGKRAVAGFAKTEKPYLVFKEALADDIINKAVEQANKDIEAGLEIKSWFDKEREGFRWTQVGDYPAIPDGGLLVANTKEIGNIKFAGKEMDQGKQKVTISLA